MSTHICPASHARFLSTSLRRFIHDPYKILKGKVSEGQTAIDIGCGPGFFTLPMAKLTGQTGTVIAADLQQEMLNSVSQRAKKRGLDHTIRLHLCRKESIGIAEKADFILAFYMVHEVPDPRGFFQEVRTMLKPGGRLLFVEPKFHVTRKRFREFSTHAVETGLVPESKPGIRVSRSVLYRV